MCEYESTNDRKVQNKLDSIAPLSNQVAVVTGAARGIGEAIALRLARMGAAVVLTARDQARLAEVKAGIEQQGGKALVLPCDLTDEKAVAAFGERVEQEHGRCDILVNNAGVGVLRKPLIDLPVEEWDQMMHTNLRGALPHDPIFGPDDDRGQVRPYHQHFVTRRKECPARGRRLFRLQMGIEWPDVFGGGRTAAIQRARFGHRAGFGQHAFRGCRQYQGSQRG